MPVDKSQTTGHKHHPKHKPNGIKQQPTPGKITILGAKQLTSVTSFKSVGHRPPGPSGVQPKVKILTKQQPPSLVTKQHPPSLLNKQHPPSLQTKPCATTTASRLSKSPFSSEKPQLLTKLRTRPVAPTSRNEPITPESNLLGDADVREPVTLVNPGESRLANPFKQAWRHHVDTTKSFTVVATAGLGSSGKSLLCAALFADFDVGMTAHPPTRPDKSHGLTVRRCNDYGVLTYVMDSGPVLADLKDPAAAYLRAMRQVAFQIKTCNLLIVPLRLASDRTTMLRLLAASFLLASKVPKRKAVEVKPHYANLMVVLNQPSDPTLAVDTGDFARDVAKELTEYMKQLASPDLDLYSSTPNLKPVNGWIKFQRPRVSCVVVRRLSRDSVSTAVHNFCDVAMKSVKPAGAHLSDGEWFEFMEHVWTSLQTDQQQHAYLDKLQGWLIKCRGV